MEEIARVIDGHDDDDQATQHVDGGQAIGALIGGVFTGAPVLILVADIETFPSSEAMSVA